MPAPSYTERGGEQWIILLIHAASVFGPGSLFGASWEERKIREIMEKERARGR